MTAPRVAVLAVGDELLAGYVLECNGAAIANALADLGIAVGEIRVVGDDEARIAGALIDLAEEFAFVFVTGGLGPTLDDVTRQAAARAAGVELALSEIALEEVRAWWRGRTSKMPATNERQAMMPVGAVHIQNTDGTAPGFRMNLGDSVVIALPGPPREMSNMLESEVMPWLSARMSPPDVRRAEFYLFGISESVFVERVGAWMERGANPEIGVTASRGVLSVRMRAEGTRDATAQDRLDRLAAQFRERFDDQLFSESDPALEVALAHGLIERKLSISFAESCTGGQVAASLCRLPGISAVFSDGFVTYSDDAKVSRLGVSPDLIRQHGAVSEQVAAAMAEGACRMSGARMAVAISGIAGPDGGTAEKPIGAVWFAISVDGLTETLFRQFPARSRQWIRDAATRTALHLAWIHLPGGRPEPLRSNAASQPAH